MAESSDFTDVLYYQMGFDSRGYIKNLYTSPDGYKVEKSRVPFVLQSMSKTFSSGRYTGKRLIEVGSGPSIHTVISACEHFDEIVLSDFVDRNRMEIEKWLKNEEGCFDWKPIIKYVSEMDGRSPSDVEEKLRQRVKQVLKCNVLSKKPFHPENMEPADCVITSLCLEAACKDLQSYRDALCGIVQLIRPGGVLILVGVLGETFYYVDQTRFSCLELNKDDVMDAVKSLNLTVQEFSLFPVRVQKVYFFLVAEKSNI